MLDTIEEIRRKYKIAPAILAAALSACATESLLLNSERIEQQFGSYGIDVLASEASLRRSSLYSIDQGERTCRTYAIVRFTDDLDNSYKPLHAKVLDGNSLGEVFKSNGWAIHKQTLHIGSFQVDSSFPELFRLMRLQRNHTLAMHVYQLLLVKGSENFEYATIIEAHHPDYLLESDLLRIYEYDDSENLSSASKKALISLLAHKGNDE